MSRAFFEAVCLSGLLVLTACGGDDDDTEKLPDIETLFPANDAVGTWTENTSAGAAGIETATPTSVFAMINGDADPFASRDFVAFAREHYTDGTYTLELRVWQMRSKADAIDVYDSLPSEDALYDLTWTAVALGEEGRVGDTGSTLWINTHKNAYHIEGRSITPNDGGAQSAATPLLQAVLADIP